MTTPLNIRQHVIQRLLAIYAQLDDADESTKLILEAEKSTLEHKLYVLDRNLVKISKGMVEQRSNKSQTAPSDADEAATSRALHNALRGNKFTKKEVDFLLSQLGNEEQKSAIDAWLDAFFGVVETLERLQDQLQPFKHQLSPHNPFAMLDQARQAVQSNGAEFGYKSLTQFIEQQEAAAQQYHDTGSLDGLVTPLALYAHDRELTAWQQIELNALSQYAPGSAVQKLSTFINSAFDKEGATKAWQKLKRLADIIDERNQAQIDGELFAWQPNAPVHAGRHPEESTGSTNTIATGLPSVVPRFVDDQGKPYAHTQVLCWRYRKSDPEQLGHMNIDRLLPNLTTIGFLYTDHDGKPTLHKPSFLTNRGHSIQLQIDPETGDTLLLEKTSASKPTSFITDDPLLANWFSYGMPEHIANINQAINSFAASTPIDDVHNFSTQPLDKFGLKADSRLFETITGSDITGFFELAEGYHYGFMLLPLGFGSVGIQNIAQLPNQFANGQPISVKQQLTEPNSTVVLPRTLRQYNYECYQARNGLFMSQQNMLKANTHKQSDIARVEKLKQWVQYNADYPYGGKQRLNQKAKSELNEALSALQEGIRQSQFRTRVMSSLNDKDDAAKYHIYLKQRETVSAFLQYEQWVTKGFELIENQPMFERIQAWAEAQQVNDNLGQQHIDLILNQCEFLVERKDRLAQLPPLNWTPPITQTPNLCSPYTPLVYDGILGVIALLTQSHRDEELYGKHLLPAVNDWINRAEVTQTVSQIADRLNSSDIEVNERSFSVAALNATLENELTEQTSPLAKIFGAGFDIAKTTFVRGPGAPALLEGILELTSMLLLVGYKANTKIQVNVLIRLQMLQVATMTGLHVLHHQRPMAKIMVYFTRKTNTLNPTRLLNTRTLTQRAYGGDVWGTQHVTTKFEGHVKTLLFFYTKYEQLKQFMDHMNKDAWDNPTENDFRDASYQFFEALISGGNEVSALLATPGMIKFWQTTLNLPKGKVISVIESSITKGAQTGTRLIFGGRANPKLINWLVDSSTGVNSASKVMSAWASRISFATSAIACAQSLADTGRNVSLGREYDAMRSTVEAVGHGMIATGALMGLVGCNAIPVAGQALFVAGLVISVGLIAWDYYWERAGRAHFFSDTFVVFDDDWRAMRSQPHYNTYIDEYYGANEPLKTACKTIEDKYQNTILDAFQAQTITETMRTNNAISTNSKLQIYNGLARLFGLKETQLLDVPDINHDVRWNNLNWIAGARLLEQKNFLLDDKGNVRADKACDLTDVSPSDITLALAMYNSSDAHEDDKNEREETAKIFLFDWLRNIKAIQENYHAGTDTSPEAAATAEIIWPALVNATFPDDYSISDLMKAKYPFVSLDERERVVGQFLNRWKKMAESS